MNVKDTWTVEDFEEMGWHDNHIHAIFFPDENLELCLDIDYLFKWILDDVSSIYSYWVSPCILCFFDVQNLKISIDFKNTIGLVILDINKHNSRLSPNKKTTLWDFEIMTDKGYIKFESSGYSQIVKKQPVLSRNPILDREKWSRP